MAQFLESDSILLCMSLSNKKIVKPFATSTGQ
ncbi:Uncharacterised protein g3818 [Pycnogonum litorale]